MRGKGKQSVLKQRQVHEQTTRLLGRGDITLLKSFEGLKQVQVESETDPAWCVRELEDVGLRLDIGTASSHCP